MKKSKADVKKKIIPISFRNDETWIYDEICNHSSKGGWVKDVLADHIRGSQTKK